MMVDITFEDDRRIPVNLFGLNYVQVKEVFLLTQFSFLNLRLTGHQKLQSVFLPGVYQNADYRNPQKVNF